MAFEYPSTITARKEKEKKMKAKKKGTEADYHKNMSDKEMNEMEKTFKPITSKKEGIKKELSMMQIDDAISRTKNSDKISKKGMKKVVDAAADDKQLETSKRHYMRNEFKSGGRINFKGGGCAIKGKGKAYGKNS
jgi:hypothetical protein